MESRAPVSRNADCEPTAAPISEEAFHRFSDIFGCKWTLAILEALERGVSRPSALQRDLPGLTAKILNQRIRKLSDYGLIERQEFAEIPPRVEYSLSQRGKRLRGLVQEIRAFAANWESE